MRKILITNDDGVKSRGIKILTEMLKPFGEITVVAPFEPMSGMSSALTIGKPLRLTELKNGDGVRIWACSGTPADCIKMAMNQIFVDEPPHFLFSGINHGSNASIASLYSGTLGAAAEGTIYGIPSMGFSMDSHNPDIPFDSVIEYGTKLIEQFIENPPVANTYINVNFPPVATEEVKGVKFTTQGRGRWTREFQERLDPYGFNYYWMTGQFLDLEEEEGRGDHNLLKEHYITVVPHKIDNTDYSEIERLSKSWKL